MHANWDQRCVGCTCSEDYDRQRELAMRRSLYWARRLRLTPSEVERLPAEELERRLHEVQLSENAEEERRLQFKRWQDISELRWLMYEEQRKHNERCGGPGGVSIWRILANAQHELEEKLQMNKIRRGCSRFPSPMCVMDEARIEGGNNSVLKPLRSVLSGCSADEDGGPMPGHKKQRGQLMPPKTDKKPPKTRTLAQTLLKTGTCRNLLPCTSESESENNELQLKAAVEEEEAKTPTDAADADDENDASECDSTHYLRKFESLPKNYSSLGVHVPVNGLLQLSAEVPDMARLEKKYERMTCICSCHGSCHSILPTIPKASHRCANMRPHRIFDTPGYVDPLLLYVKEKFNVDALHDTNSSSSAASYCSAQEPMFPFSCNPCPSYHNNHNSGAHQPLAYCPLCDARHLRLPQSF
ncbi:uncharacterized protein LOC115632519 [Scaptodrosophila lebanonensis]|uniref:Uncharacterized protein LOC115632519 n=1 Tax=Drosophila lebanonensis TaxID=7225 RepID=A0A6J2UB34_DROLE|nr:uncharacterized protein LOC115632519 [Scaptodrosophila lebanonensis]